MDFKQITEPQLVTLMGATKAQFSGYLRDGLSDLKDSVTGLYDARAAFRWYIDNIARPASIGMTGGGVSGAGLGDDLDEMDLQTLTIIDYKAKAEQYELKYRNKLNQYRTDQECRTAIESTFDGLSSILDSLIEELPCKISGVSKNEILLETDSYIKQLTGDRSDKWKANLSTKKS